MTNRDDTEGLVYEYEGRIYPTYLKHGNACQFLAPIAKHFCAGEGLDIGASKWPLPGATPWELKDGNDGMKLPDKTYDYLVASHVLEHLIDPVGALLHWKSRLKPGGVLLLYLPHTDMVYWRTSRLRKHLHQWQPQEMAQIVRDLGFVNVLNSERDLCWSFAVVGFKP